MSIEIENQAKNDILNSMKKERHKAVPAVYGIFKKDKQVLLGRRQNTRYYDGWYGFPAGHVEANELPKKALIREIKEEVGVDVTLEDIEFAHILYRTAHDETGDRVDLFFIIKKWTGEPKIMEPHKCDDLQWFSLNNLPEKRIHHEKNAMDCIDKEINFSEISEEQAHQNPNKI